MVNNIFSQAYILPTLDICSISPKAYFEKQKKLEDLKEDSVCNTPTGGSPSVQKTIFSKPRLKNRITKLTDSPKLSKID